ncbi:hypothetical protein M3201_25070 [Paenibacillus motobuensis]|nr:MULTISPECIES: hypothetical protein [Paenibacillus]MCM3042934.1 hypothetical protein [Paenibacillus lutimineralis]MCM3650038.1 hypothetical protein [Paenibacillus motobuensis]
MAFVLQDSLLFKGAIRDNITFGRLQFVPEVNWDIPASSVLIFDNSGI